MSNENKEKHLPLFVVIPANVHFNKAISDKEVRVYGYISALANYKGYCYASNKYLAETFDVSEKTIQRAVSNLTKENLLRAELVRDSEGMVVERRLYILLPEIQQTLNKPHNDSMDKNVHRGMDKNVQYNNINNNIYGDVDTSSEHSKKISSKKSDVEDKQSKLKTSPKKKSKIIVVDEDSTYSRIMKHFNSKDNTKFKANAKEYVENIDNLLQAYTEEEIIAVIDYVRENNYKAEYFRPSTIFRLSNFERNYEFYVRNLDTKKACTTKAQAEHKTYYIVKPDLQKVIASPYEPQNIDSSLIYTDKLSAEAKLQELL